MNRYLKLTLVAVLASVCVIPLLAVTNASRPVPPALTSTASNAARADCALRTNQQLRRGEMLGAAPVVYMSDAGLVNVHINITDSMRNVVRSTRCVYTRDGKAFIRGQ
jgi:hypothetical protein